MHIPKIRYHKCGQVLVWVKGAEGARGGFYNGEGQPIKRCSQCGEPLKDGDVSKEQTVREAQGRQAA